MPEAREYSRMRDGARLTLGPAAIDAYRRAGWTITPLGLPDPGVTLGPCARCGALHELYGPNGRPLCDHCQAAA